MGFEWKDLAEDFSARQRAIVGRGLYDQVSAELARLGDLGEAVEVACGDGGFTALVAPLARRLVATDLEESMCTVARRRLTSFAHVEVLMAEGQALPFGTGRFDTALALNFLHILSLQDRGAVLTELKRVLRPGGRLVVMDFGMDGMTPDEIAAMVRRYEAAFGPVGAKKKPVTFDGLTAEVEASGFRLERRVEWRESMGSALVLTARRI